MEKLAYSINETAKVLSLGRTSIYALISEGRLATVTLCPCGRRGSRNKRNNRNGCVARRGWPCCPCCGCCGHGGEESGRLPKLRGSRLPLVRGRPVVDAQQHIRALWRHWCDYGGDLPPECRSLTCGARTRAGTPCKRRDLYRSGRCKLHGGLSTGPRTAKGKLRSARNGKRTGAGKPHERVKLPDDLGKSGCQPNGKSRGK
jgi:hypothetical protein